MRIDLLANLDHQAKTSRDANTLGKEEINKTKYSRFPNDLHIYPVIYRTCRIYNVTLEKMVEQKHDPAFNKLIGFLQRIPATYGFIGSGFGEGGDWWVKFTINPDHKYSWHAVQELGCILNYLSINDRLPTAFKPVSPAPYMNGGPHNYLAWVIEGNNREISPDLCAEWLEGRMPSPVEDLSNWVVDEDFPYIPEHQN